jgi:hypothetical protein
MASKLKGWAPGSTVYDHASYHTQNPPPRSSIGRSLSSRGPHDQHETIIMIFSAISGTIMYVSDARAEMS